MPVQACKGLLLKCRRIEKYRFVNRDKFLLYTALLFYFFPELTPFPTNRHKTRCYLGRHSGKSLFPGYDARCQMQKYVRSSVRAIVANTKTNVGAIGYISTTSVFRQFIMTGSYPVFVLACSWLMLLYCTSTYLPTASLTFLYTSYWRLILIIRSKLKYRVYLCGGAHRNYT